MTDPAAADRRVHVLPPDIADKIAAGEVVERPASVVKELVENALDAGARRITIELEGAGTALISVVDDGEGMGAEDAVCAFARHATSKVRAVDDLARIATLGFRGEALASIAAVSRTTLVTRRHADLAGTRVEVHGGTIVDVRAAGTPPGTRVDVAELFGLVPARLKFLKAPATEVGHVSELVTRTALAWPQVGFVLRHGGRTLVELAAVEEPAERVWQVFGDERAGAMVSFVSRGAIGCVYGWLSDSRLTFPSARHIYTYVNHRYIRDKLVSHALVAGYSTLLMHGRYPAAAVFLDVPLDEVDVNVHPAKSEVRFRRGGAVHELISRAVQERLREQGGERMSLIPAPPSPQIPVAPLPGAAMSQPPLRLVDQGPGAGRWGAALREEAERAGSPGLASFPQPQALGSHASPSSASVPTVTPPAFFGSLRVLGQVFEGYLVAESEDSLVLIDQHAAHERVTFERLRSAYVSGALPRQGFLVPAVVQLGPREAAVLGERLEELGSLGFEVELFGGGSFRVRAVPALLGDIDPAQLLRDVAEELTEVGRSQRLAEAAEGVLARLACHSAVRVGQSLGAAQIRSLLVAMDSVDFAGNCPHGRPAYIRFARAELERWFKRT